METIKQMRKRHEGEIEEFQNNCPHKKTVWMPYMWAPGHFGANVRVCKRCEKIIERETLDFGETNTASTPDIKWSTPNVELKKTLDSVSG